MESLKGSNLRIQFSTHLFEVEVIAPNIKYYMNTLLIMGVTQYTLTELLRENKCSLWY